MKGIMKSLPFALLMVLFCSFSALAASPFAEPAAFGFQAFLVNLLNNSFIAALLLTIGLAGILIELFISGFGIAGTIGVGAFVLYFLGNIWAGHVTAAVFILFIVGLLMLIAEIFVTPGMGALGIFGIAAILFSIFWAAPNAGYAATAIIIALILSIALLVLSFKLGKTRKVWDKLILKVKQQNDSGYVAPNVDLFGLLGAEGTAITILRPAGTALFDGKRVDVVTAGEFIEPKTPVKVIQVEGLRVVVQAIE